MRRRMVSIALGRAARWIAKSHKTPKLVRSMASVSLAVVLTACVGETTSSMDATPIAPSTIIEEGSSSVAGSITPSTTSEKVSPTVAGPYEAVFLRLEALDDTLEGPVFDSADTVVVAVGVNPQGEEREIARLPGAWVSYSPEGGPYLRPLGAVSPTGLLAMPSEDAEFPRLTMQWEIFDLLHPEAEPVIIDGVREHVELVGWTPYYPSDLGSAAFWGPDERLAITWGPAQSGLLSFVEGRTGAVTTLELPGEEWAPFPAWAADGSGVFTSGETVLRPDGTRTASARRSAKKAVTVNSNLRGRRSHSHRVSKRPRWRAWLQTIR